MAQRSSQVVQEVLESYSNATNLRSSQVVQEVLESYTNPTNLRASQVVLEVLRTVASIPNALSETIALADSISAYRIYNFSLSESMILADSVPGTIFTFPGRGNYVFRFANEVAAFSDPIVGPYLNTPRKIIPLAVYDLSVDSVNTLPGWWCLLDVDPPVVSTLANHPNLQFLVDRNAEFQPGYSTGGGTAIIINNMQPPSLINRLQIVNPALAYATKGLH